MTERESDGTTPGLNADEPEALEPRVAQTVARMKDALSEGNGSEAVRFFRDAVSNKLIVEDEELLNWLRRSMGKVATEKFLTVFSRLPCFYCNRGVLRCEECDGRGHDEDGTLCSECLSLGIDRCGFCGGSGWFTINHVPRALQLQVILRRVLAAGKDADAVLADAVPVVSATQYDDAKKEAARALLQVNRLLGVLENMAEAARREETERAESAATAQKVVAACLALAQKLEERACELLTVLADASSREAASIEGEDKSRLAQRRAKFFSHLASSKSFAGTLLRHPLLIPESSVEPDSAEESKVSNAEEERPEATAPEQS